MDYNNMSRDELVKMIMRAEKPKRSKVVKESVPIMPENVSPVIIDEKPVIDVSFKEKKVKKDKPINVAKEIKEKGITTIEKDGNNIKVEKQLSKKYSVEQLKNIVKTIECPKVDMVRLEKYKSTTAMMNYLKSVNCPVIKIVE